MVSEFSIEEVVEFMAQVEMNVREFWERDSAAQIYSDLRLLAILSG